MALQGGWGTVTSWKTGTTIRRAEYKSDAFASSTTAACLLTSFTVPCWVYRREEVSSGSAERITIVWLYVWLLRLSTVLGISAMLLIATTAGYSRTSMATMKHDGPAVLAFFLKQTQAVRKRGFYCMYLGAVVYSTGLSLSSWYSFEEKVAPLVAVTLLLVLLLTVLDTQKLLKESALIYQTDSEVQRELDAERMS